MESLPEYDGSQDPNGWVNRIRAYCNLNRTFAESEIVEIALLLVNTSIKIDENISTLEDLISALRSSKPYKLRLKDIRDKLSVIKYNDRDNLFGFVNMIRSWVFELGLENDVDCVRGCLINASANETIKKKFEEKSSNTTDVEALLETFYDVNATLNRCIKYGDTIILKHVLTGSYLSSNHDLYRSGSKFQIVFGKKGINYKDNYWTVETTGPSKDDYVRYKEMIRLQHVVTGQRLHSHRITSPKTEQQEVCCFANYDSNDYWTPLLMSNAASDDFWKVDDFVRLKHVTTYGMLHSHRCFLDDGRQEVTCFYGNDDNDKWQAMFKD